MRHSVRLPARGRQWPTLYLRVAASARFNRDLH